MKIENRDYALLKEFDSKDTFYYLDPPYTGSDVGLGKIDLSELLHFCKNLKGNFILSLNNNSENKKLFNDYIVKIVRVSQQMSLGGSMQDFRTELLISNFPFRKTNIYL